MSDLEKIIVLKGKKYLFKVETSPLSSEYAKYEELRNEIWGFPEDNLPGTRNMLCENYLHEGSSLFIAVYAEGEDSGLQENRENLVGFSYGFVGVKDKSVAFRSLDNLWFYSQYTGVKAAFQGRGLGIMIKEYQREALKDLFGIYTVTCTYDPLTAVNASRNVHHFGMEVLEYRAAAYGEYGGLLNRKDVPSDRFFMSWDLSKPAQGMAGEPVKRPEAGRQAIQVEYLSVPGETGMVELETVKEVNLEARPEALFVRIPVDYYLMLRQTDVTDPGIHRIPLDWRMSTRNAFQTYLGRGYRVVDFQKFWGPPPIFFYVLKHPS